MATADFENPAASVTVPSHLTRRRVFAAISQSTNGGALSLPPEFEVSWALQFLLNGVLVGELRQQFTYRYTVLTHAGHWLPVIQDVTNQRYHGLYNGRDTFQWNGRITADTGPEEGPEEIEVFEFNLSIPALSVNVLCDTVRMTVVSWDTGTAICPAVVLLNVLSDGQPGTHDL